jgi:hypothetical protein
VLQPPQDPSRHRALLPHLHLLQRRHERFQVLLHLRDVLGKRAGSLVDIVCDLRRILAVLEALQPGPRRVVDPLRHQIGKLCVTEKDRVGRTRTPTDVLPEKSQVMAEYALSFLEFLGAESVRPVSERKPLEGRFSRTCPAELPSHQRSPGISGCRIRRRG